MFVGQSLFSPFGFKEEVGWAGHSLDGGHFTVQGKLRDNSKHSVIVS